MSLSIEDATRFAQVFKNPVSGVPVTVLDKHQAVRLALMIMFAGGHLSFEDASGAGRTALARAISAVIDGAHLRIQFIPDPLPPDTTGANMFNQKTGERVFRAGPVFAEIALADEINRASPKAQSAPLEVMEEVQVTVDGVRRPVPQLLMVTATQNPVGQAGTYPLPGAQLDRFLMKTSIGYPLRSAMIDVLDGSTSSDRSKNLQPMVSGQDIVVWSALAADNHTGCVVLDYVAALAETTRENESSILGVSTCGAIGIVRCTRVWVAAQGRNFILPGNVKALAAPLQVHRTVVDPGAAFFSTTSEGVIQRALTSIPAPAVGA